jgi:two-component system sensor histidine kinase/response regulator
MLMESQPISSGAYGPPLSAAVAHSDIMIVDDNPANLMLLEDMLTRQGHEVRSFPLGRLALAAARRTPPDLILLDINMPELNGYEVCELLKSSAELSDIPVIFLSALNETQDKVKAFESGAVDYISKPFQFEEVHARVETHLKLHDLQRALKLHNEHLEEAVAARTRELADANRRLTLLDSSKNAFLNLISHEFRTPLQGLLGVGELILDEIPGSDRNDELRDIFAQSRRRILSILDDALLLTEINVKGMPFQGTSVSLSATLNRAVDKAGEFAKFRKVSFATPSEQGLHPVVGDEALLVRAFQSLLETAVRFSEKGETVRLVQELAPDSRRIIIESRGMIIPETALPRFFDLFSISEAITRGGDLGLGPPVASRILSLFGGSVTVANLEPSGIRLTILLKNAPLN